MSHEPHHRNDVQDNWQSDNDSWPDDDDRSWPGQQPWPARPPYGLGPGGRGPAGRPGRTARGFWVAATAVAGVVLVAIVTLVVVRTFPGAASAGSSPGTPPAGAVTGGRGGGGSGTLFMGGQVVSVSAASITLGGQGHQITAAITSATKFTGVSGPGQIKPGDRVSAEISGYGSGHPVATGIQDPAKMP